MSELFPKENVKSFADKVRNTNYGKKYGDADDLTIAVGTLRDHPVYQYRFSEKKLKGGFFQDGLKNFVLGAGGDTFTGNVSGLLKSAGLALSVMNEEEFNNSEESKKQSYEDYVRLANIQKSASEKLLTLGQTIDDFAKEDLPQILNTDTEYSKSLFGQLTNGVSRALGQFAGMVTTQVATRGLGRKFGLTGKTLDRTADAAVYQQVLSMRMNESLNDYESITGKDLVEMSLGERKTGLKSMLTYSSIAAALEFTAFKYIGGLLSNQVKTLEQLRKGGKVREGLLKDVIKRTAGIANAKGLAEGSQEALGDGMMLDLTAKLFYDEDRELFSLDTLKQRAMEFTIGYGAGAIGGTAMDFATGKVGAEARSEALERYEQETGVSLGSTTPTDPLFNLDYTDIDSGEQRTVEVQAKDPEEAIERFKATYKGYYDLSKGVKTSDAKAPTDREDLVLGAREIKSPAKRQFTALKEWKENPSRSDKQTKAAINELKRTENSDVVGLSQDLARLYADRNDEVTLYRVAPRNRNYVKDLNAGWTMNPYQTRTFADAPIEIYDQAVEDLRNEIADPAMSEDEFNEILERRTDVSDLTPEMLVAQVPVNNILYLDNDNVFQVARGTKRSQPDVYQEDEVLLEDTNRIRVLENFDVDMDFYASNLLTPGGIQLSDDRDARSDEELEVIEEYRKSPRQQYFDEKTFPSDTLTESYYDGAVLHAGGTKLTENTPAKELNKKYIDDRTPIAIGSTFSGGGTLELALAQAGLNFKKVFAVEYNPLIIAEHNRIHGTDFTAQSIADVDWKQMLLKHPELANSYMHHSPVCKRYSSMTRAARIKQEKEFAEGKTEDPYFLDKISASKIVESINVITPPLITIENVADYKGSPEMSKIRRALKKKGYFISEDVIDTKYLGSAQSRKRLIVRASKLSEPEPVEALGYEERADNITGDWYVSLKKQIKREQNKGALSREYFKDKTSYIRNLSDRFKTKGQGGFEYPRNLPYLHIGTNGMSGLSYAGTPTGTIMAAQIATGKREGEFKGQNAYLFIPDTDPRTGKPKNMEVVETGRREVEKTIQQGKRKGEKKTVVEFDDIYLKNGKAYLVTADMYPRLMGLNNNANYPNDVKLARGLMGNGMQAELTEKIIAPFIQTQGYYTSVTKTVDDIQLEDLKDVHDEQFFTWFQQMLDATGLRLKADLSNLDYAADAAVRDVYNWLQDNPSYLTYYDKDLEASRKIIEEIYGKIPDSEYNLFKTIMGLTSPNTALPINTLESLRTFAVFKDTNNFDTTIEYLEYAAEESKIQEEQGVPAKDRIANLMGTKRNAVITVLQIAKEKGGIQEALDFLKGTDTIANISAYKKTLSQYSSKSANVGEPGYVREIVHQATGQAISNDMQVPRMFMFGPKVGAYTLNLNGESQYTTTDIWEGRFIRSYFKGMFKPAEDGKKAEFGLPIGVDDAIFFQKFAGAFNKIFNRKLKEQGKKQLEPSAMQAQRWFYILEKTNKAGYKDARTNETISGYVRQAATKLEGFNPRVGGRSTRTDQERITDEEEVLNASQDIRDKDDALQFTSAEQKIAFQNTEKYIRKNFEEIISRPELQGLGLKFSYNKANPTAMYNPSTHEIVVNPKKVVRQFGGMENKRGYSSLMREELIHAVAAVALTKRVNGARVAVGKRPLTITENLLDFFSDLGAKLSKSEIQELELAYNDGRKMSDYNLGGEYFRVVLQKASYGAITEQTDKFYGENHKEVTKLLKGAQKYIATELKDSVLIDNETTLIFRDTARLLASLDSKAKPYNETLVQQTFDIISPVTDQVEPTLDNFLGIRTEPKQPGKPPTIKGEKGRGVTNWFNNFTIPVGQVLRDLDPRLERIFTDFIMTRDMKILRAHKATQNLSKKYKSIKDSTDSKRLKQILMFSPFNTSEMTRSDQLAIVDERDNLLRKYDMFNEFRVVKTELAKIRQEGLDQGMEIGELEEYFPRVLSKEGRDKLLRLYGDPQSAVTFKEYIKFINNQRKENKRTVYKTYIAHPTEGIEKGPTFRTEQAAINFVAKNQYSDYKAMPLPDPLAPIMPKSAEEAVELENYLNKYGKFTKGNQPRFSGTRKIELIPDDMLEFYDNPGDALSKYFSSMITHIETLRFAGQKAPKISQPVDGMIEYEYDPASIVGRTIQQIMNDPNVDEHKQEKIFSTFPEMYKKMMQKNASPEYPIFGWFRNFSYFSLLVEPTSTLSQLYDISLMTLNNEQEVAGSLGRAFTGQTTFKAGDFIDTARIQEEFKTDNDKFIKAIQVGLKYTGFQKLDVIMKEATMDANYRRYQRIAKDLNLDGTVKRGLKGKKLQEAEKMLAELNTYIGPRVTREGEVEQMIRALKIDHAKRSKEEKALIGSTLVRKLFENQPLTELRMPLAVMNNPNLRGLYTLKSFMIVQLNTFNQETAQKIFTFNKYGVPTGFKDAKSVKEGTKNLVKMITFFALVGIPVDVIKDMITGRVGYMSDYTFNSIVRIAGINKYHLYQMRKEGVGRTLLDFTLPVPLMRFIDVTQQAGEITFGTWYDMEEKSFADAFGHRVRDSRVLTNIPLFDMLQYRFPETREKLRERVDTRKKKARDTKSPFRNILEQASPEPFAPTRAAFEMFSPLGD